MSFSLISCINSNKITITTKSYKGIEPAEDLKDKEKIIFSEILNKEIDVGNGKFKAFSFFKSYYTKTGISDQRIKGGSVYEIKGIRKDNKKSDLDACFIARNKQDVNDFPDFIIQFLKENNITLNENETLIINKDKDSTSCNIKVGSLDLTCSLREYTTRSRTDKEATEIFIDIENDAENPCFVFPVGNNNREKFEEKNRSITSGCTINHLDTLEGPIPLLLFFFNMFIHQVVENDKFIYKLINKSVKHYSKSDDKKNYGESNKHQVSDYTTEHTRNENSGTNLTLLVSQILSTYRNLGLNPKKTEWISYLQMLWTELTYPQVDGILKNETSIFKSEEELNIYNFMISLIAATKNFSSSTDTLKDLYNNIASSLYLRYPDPLCYQLSQTGHNIIQIHPGKDSTLTITSPTGKETLPSEYVFSNSPIFVFQKRDLTITHIQKDIFSSSWFEGFKAPINEERKIEFFNLFKIAKNEKKIWEVQELFKKLSQYLDIKENPFDHYIPPNNVSMETILKQWIHILTIWKGDLSLDKEYLEWLNGTAKMVLMAYLSAPESFQTKQLIILYCHGLSELLVSSDEEGLETYSFPLESHSLPFITPQQMVDSLYDTIKQFNNSHIHTLTILLPYVKKLIQMIDENEVKSILSKLKTYIPELIRDIDDSSSEELSLLIEIIHLTKPCLDITKKRKKEKSFQTNSLQAIQQQLKEELEIPKLINLILFFQKNGVINELEDLKKLQSLINFYLSQYSLENNCALNCWLGLLNDFLNHNLIIQASSRLEEIFVYGNLNQEGQLDLVFNFLEKAGSSLEQWPIIKKGFEIILQQKNLDVSSYIKLLDFWLNIIKHCMDDPSFMQQSEQLFNTTVIFFSSHLDKQAEALSPIFDWMTLNTSFLTSLVEAKRLYEFSRFQKSQEIKSIQSSLQQNYSDFLRSFAKTKNDEILSKNIDQLIDDFENKLLLNLITINIDNIDLLKDVDVLKKFIETEISRFISSNISQDAVGTHVSFLFSLALLAYKNYGHHVESKNAQRLFQALWTDILYPQMEKILKKKQTIQSNTERLLYQFIQELTKELTEVPDTLSELYHNISSSLQFLMINRLSSKNIHTIRICRTSKPTFIETVLNDKTFLNNISPEFSSFIISIDRIQGDVFSSATWLKGLKAPLSVEEKTRFSKPSKNNKANKNHFKIQDIFNTLLVYLNIKKNSINECLIPTEASFDDWLEHWNTIFTQWQKTRDSHDKIRELLNAISRILAFLTIAKSESPYIEKWQSFFFELFLKLLMENNKKEKLFEVYSIPNLTQQQMACHLIMRIDSSENDLHKILTILLPQIGTSLQNLNEKEKTQLTDTLKQLFPAWIQQTDITSTVDLKHLLQIIHLVYPNKEALSELEMQKDLIKLKLIGFLEALHKEIDCKSSKDLQKLTSLMNFYLNLTSLDDENSVKCWLDIFNEFLNNQHSKEALKILNEICLYANLNEEDQLNLSFKFLKNIQSTFYHWPIIETVAKILLQQKMINSTGITDLLNDWNICITSCDNKKDILKQYGHVFEQLLSFLHLNIDENCSLLTPAFEWLIVNSAFLIYIIQVKNDEEIVRAENTIKKALAIFLKGFQKKHDLLTNYAAFLFSLAKAAQYSKLSGDIRKLTSYSHNQLLIESLSNEKKTPSQLIEIMDIRLQWNFLEDSNNQTQLNVSIIQAFFDLNFEESSSLDLINSGLTKILCLFKALDSSTLKELLSLLIRGAHVAIEKKYFSLASEYYALVDKNNLITEHDAVLEFLEPVMAILKNEVSLSKKNAESLQSIIVKFYTLLNIKDLVVLFESLLDKSHSHTFCINLAINNKITNQEILILIIKKFNSNKQIFLNDVFSFILPTIQDATSAKQHFFLLEHISTNIKNSKNIIGFLKKLISFASDFTIEDLCLISKYISKFPLNNLNISFQKLTSILINNWTKTEKSIIKKFFNALNEKEQALLASDYLEFIFANKPCLEDLQWEIEKHITLIKNTLFSSLVKFYIKEKHLKEASSIMSIFMENSQIITEDDCKLLFELHLNMVLADPTSLICWFALGNNTEYTLTSIKSLSENEITHYISLMNQIMQPKNLKFFAIKDTSIAFFNIILPFVCNPNLALTSYTQFLKKTIKNYYFKCLSTLLKLKIEKTKQVDVLYNFLNLFLNYINTHSASFFIPGEAQDFIASLLYATFDQYLDKDEALKNSAELLAVRLNVTHYLSQKSSYQLLNYRISLLETITLLPKNYREVYESQLALLCFNLIASELLDPIERGKKLVDDYFVTEKTTEHFKMHLKWNLYLCRGLLKVKNIKDLKSAITLLIELLEKSFILATKAKDYLHYFSLANDLIQYAINLNIELKTVDSNYHEIKKIALEKNLHASKIEYEDKFKIEKISPEEIDEIFKPFNAFVVEYQKQLNHYIETIAIKLNEKEKIDSLDISNTNYLSVLLLSSCVRQQSYVNTNIKEIEEVNTKTENSSDNDVTKSILSLSSYVAIARKRLFVRKEKPTKIIEWMKKFSCQRSKLSGTIREIILHNIQLLMQESFVSKSDDHREFAYSLIYSLEKLFELSEMEKMNVLSEVILAGLSNPEAFDLDIFREILNIINIYIIDNDSKVLFKYPIFFIKKIITGILLLRQIDFSKDYPAWFSCLNYLQDLLYHRFLPLKPEDAEERLHDQLMIRLDEYYHKRLKISEEKLKEDHILLPILIGCTYDQMVISLLTYYVNTIKEVSSEKEMLELPSQTFNFFIRFNYLADSDTVKKKLEKLLE